MLWLGELYLGFSHPEISQIDQSPHGGIGLVLKSSQVLQRRVVVVGKEGLGTGLGLCGAGTFSRQ